MNERLKRLVVYFVILLQPRYAIIWVSASYLRERIVVASSVSS